MDQQLHSIIEHLPINILERKVLLDNGFDDLESLKLLDLNTLVALGINNPEEVFEAIQEILDHY